MSTPQESDYKPGSMDIGDHLRTYAAFVSGGKWVAGGILLVLILLAIFRTN